MVERNTVGDLLRDHAEELYAADAVDTAGVLQMSWRGLDALQRAGRLLAAAHVDYAVLERHARPILTRALEILRMAPSLPSEVTPLTLSPTGEAGPLGDHDAYVIHRGLLDTAYALIMVLPTAAGHARTRADRKACREAARLAYHLVNCYEGRLDLFLSPREHEVG